MEYDIVVKMDELLFYVLYTSFVDVILGKRSDLGENMLQDFNQKVLNQIKFIKGDRSQKIGLFCGEGSVREEVGEEFLGCW